MTPLSYLVQTSYLYHEHRPTREDQENVNRTPSCISVRSRTTETTRVTIAAVRGHIFGLLREREEQSYRQTGLQTGRQNESRRECATGGRDNTLEPATLGEWVWAVLVCLHS